VNQVAREAGVNQGSLSRFINGKRSLTLPVAERLMVFFGLRVVEPKGKAR
jgi:plasmid maintenance system antidote protein VapI